MSYHCQMGTPNVNAFGGGWLGAIRLYLQPRVLSMLFLGYSAGLPFFLVFATLSAWLRQAGVVRSTIGMLAWVGILYSIKFLWAPIVDRVPLPLLHRLLGRRRAWMLLAQIGLAAGLFKLSLADPALGVRGMALGAVFVAFCAATQDIAMDAWRIESAAMAEQGAMLATYQVGYRIALITGSAGALTIAAWAGWHASYATMAALTGIGIVTTLLVSEPHPAATRDSAVREERVIAWMERRAHWPRPLLSAGEWVMTAVVCPLLDIFGRYGAGLAALMLLFVGTYRLTEFTMGGMVNPFYIDHHYTLTQIATVVKVYGLAMSLFGVFIAGVLIARIGLLSCLVLGSVLIMMSNLGYALLATTDTPTLLGLGFANGFDNLALAVHGTSFLVFLSGLTSPRYTATQYALFSSIYALPGKLLEGASGLVVDHVGYPRFFIYTATLSLPALVLLYALTRRGLSRAGVLPVVAKANVEFAADRGC
ncbi:MAG TPA: MFS transporter [Steroidobacteraceae bacterium]|nr:MFS transporter [Steroidobacteraceae bacterium]